MHFGQRIRTFVEINSRNHEYNTMDLTRRIGSDDATTRLYETQQ